MSSYQHQVIFFGDATGKMELLAQIDASLSKGYVSINHMLNSSVELQLNKSDDSEYMTTINMNIIEPKKCDKFINLGVFCINLSKDLDNLLIGEEIQSFKRTYPYVPLIIVGMNGLESESHDDFKNLISGYEAEYFLLYSDSFNVYDKEGISNLSARIKKDAIQEIKELSSNDISFIKLQTDFMNSLPFLNQCSEDLKAQLRKRINQFHSEFLADNTKTDKLKLTEDFQSDTLVILKPLFESNDYKQKILGEKVYGLMNMLEYIAVMSWKVVLLSITGAFGGVILGLILACLPIPIMAAVPLLPFMIGATIGALGGAAVGVGIVASEGILNWIKSDASLFKMPKDSVRTFTEKVNGMQL
jgi:hypothetical protein